MTSHRNSGFFADNASPSSQFIDLLRHGNIEEASERLKISPWLALPTPSSSRSGIAPIPLMVASTYANPTIAIEMINMLMQYGASLSHREGVDIVLYACRQGVAPAVLDNLLMWIEKSSLDNQSRRFRLLSLVETDEDNLNALVQVCKSKNVVLVSHLMMLVQREMMRLSADASANRRSTNDVFLKVLEAAIEMGDEVYAIKILWLPLVLQSATYMGQSNPWDHDDMDRKKKLTTIYTCVGTALRRTMISLVSAMEAINRLAVRRAAFVYMSEFARNVDSTPWIQRVSQQYRRDQQWRKVQDVFLVRHRLREPHPAHHKATGVNGAIRQSQYGEAHPLVVLPDNLFREVIAFYQPRFDPQQEVAEITEGFCCGKEFLLGNCRCREFASAVVVYDPIWNLQRQDFEDSDNEEGI